MYQNLKATMMLCELEQPQNTDHREEFNEILRRILCQQSHQHRVRVETQRRYLKIRIKNMNKLPGSYQIDEVEWISEELDLRRTKYEPDDDFKRKPYVTYKFYLKEVLVLKRAYLTKNSMRLSRGSMNTNIIAIIDRKIGH